MRRGSLAGSPTGVKIALGSLSLRSAISLRRDELLSKQHVLGDEPGAAAHDGGGQPDDEPKDVDHAARPSTASGQTALLAGTAVELPGPWHPVHRGGPTP